MQKVLDYPRLFLIENLKNFTLSTHSIRKTMHRDLQDYEKTESDVFFLIKTKHNTFILAIFATINTTTMKNHLLTVILSMTLGMNAFAENKEVNIWPQKLPDNVTLKKGDMEQTMGDDDILRIRKMPFPTLEKFPVKNSNRDKVIIICPGGGYGILAINHEGTEIAQWLNCLGYTAYILRYRVPNDRDGALQDAQRAVRMVRAENPGKKVGIMGFSAGASLSCRTATRHKIPSYHPCDEIDKQPLNVDFAALIYPAYMDLGENNTLTPELTVDETTPPTFVFQSADDGLCNSALVITQALRNKKVPVELHIYPTGGHGYGMRAHIAKAAGIWPKLMEKWMENLK